MSPESKEHWLSAGEIVVQQPLSQDREQPPSKGWFDVHQSPPLVASTASNALLVPVSAVFEALAFASVALV